MAPRYWTLSFLAMRKCGLRCASCQYHITKVRPRERPPGDIQRTPRLTYRRRGRGWSAEMIHELTRSAERKARAAVRCRRMVGRHTSHFGISIRNTPLLLLAIVTSPGKRK